VGTLFGPGGRTGWAKSCETASRAGPTSRSQRRWASSCPGIQAMVNASLRAAERLSAAVHEQRIHMIRQCCGTSTKGRQQDSKGIASRPGAAYGEVLESLRSPKLPPESRRGRRIRARERAAALKSNFGAHATSARDPRHEYLPGSSIRALKRVGGAACSEL